MKHQIFQITLTITMMTILMGCAEGKITQLAGKQKSTIATADELPELEVDRNSNYRRGDRNVEETEDSGDTVTRGENSASDNERNEEVVIDDEKIGEESKENSETNDDTVKEDDSTVDESTEDRNQDDQQKADDKQGSQEDEQKKLEEQKRRQEEARKQAELKRQQEEARRQEELRRQEEEKRRKAEQDRQNEQKQNPPVDVPAPGSSQSPGTIAEKGFVTPTIYYFAVLNEDKSACPRVAPLFDKSGRVMTMVCTSTYKTCRLEGSCGVVQNNTMRKFNVVKKGAFTEITNQKCSFGFGVKSYCLDPFYTLAADLDIYKPGDVIYVNSVRGVQLPDGSKHTGYFVIRDMGHGIKGRGRFDFYSGTYSHKSDSNPFKKLGLADKRTQVPFVRLTGLRAEQVLKSRAFPGLPQEPIE
ncbi:3D domain-containing protein [Bdellovibrio reynosensis]|uniref:3D domain-containing protein n=1 Tax=Bdellovibrio reynosensis TaxID=2835041 RepID=A0ABY4CCM1_9BACT|nr:3D domain-containing protein [Bdellovibrio reynosensis]UOF01466.1 3D domain-containing protein [Bdellovibrio reynosensis]